MSLYRGTISLVHIRFRNGLAAQNQSIDDLPFKALWYPYGTYFSLAANVFLIFFQGYTAFLNPFSVSEFVIGYILLPCFLLLFLGYKFWKRTRWVPAAEMDIWSGRREGVGWGVNENENENENDKGTEGGEKDGEREDKKKKSLGKKISAVVVG